LLPAAERGQKSEVKGSDCATELRSFAQRSIASGGARQLPLEPSQVEIHMLGGEHALVSNL
jgi:hypothetical protein